jgi:hypothetical protein
VKPGKKPKKDKEMICPNRQEALQNAINGLVSVMALQYELFEGFSDSNQFMDALLDILKDYIVDNKLWVIIEALVFIQVMLERNETYEERKLVFEATQFTIREQPKRAIIHQVLNLCGSNTSSEVASVL